MIAVLDTDAALHALVPQWRALWRRAGSPPFQSPDWLLPWWGAFGTGRPRIATLRVGGGDLSGLLPMYLLDEGPERKLLPLGVGITDYCDALLDPALPPDAADCLLQALLGRAEGVTSCALPDLPPDAALRLAQPPPGWRETALPATPCPVLVGGAQSVPRGMLRNVRQSRHRADRSGDWSIRIAADPVSAWHDLLGLHQARWSGKGQPGGVLADPAVLAFHAAAIPRLADSGVLRMQVLEVAGRVAAVYHTLAAPGRLLFYLSGFDATNAFVSPGTLLLGHLVEQAALDGVELHFLRGSEPYKYAWGAADRMNAGRLFTPSSR